MKRELRERVFAKYNEHCAYCGKIISYDEMQVDHIIPLNGYREKGTDTFVNMNPACRRCNHYKRANSLEGFRKMIEEIPYKLMRDNYIFKVGVDYGFFSSDCKSIEFYFEKIESRCDE